MSTDNKSDSKPTLGTWSTSVAKDGSFQRKESKFRNCLGSNDFPAEANRYHIYYSSACPWANRTLIMRALKGLESVINITEVDTFLDGKTGWTFPKPEPVNKFDRLRQVYELADANYEGSITVPVLFDKKKNTIVNNESSEIIRMLNTEMKEFSSNKKAAQYDYYPKELQDKINALNDWIYPTINNGVYRCGFATTQSAYETAFKELFSSLDRVEDILSKNRYLTGDRVTEADIRLFTTLIRFDAVYYVHFKCNGRRIIDYTNIDNYMRELYSIPEIKSTININHIKKHYYESHKTINPYGIVPIGPFIDYETPNNRNEKFPNVKPFSSFLH